MKSARGAVVIVILVLSLLLPAAAGSAAGALAAGPGQQGGVALVAVWLDEPARLAQAQEAGLVLYSRQSSSQGEYLLAGATLDAGGRVPELGFPVSVLDAAPGDTGYYVAFGPPPGHKTFGPIRWSDYGDVLLDLGDQALLRTTPARAEQLPEAGAEIARITLDPKPWPAAAAEPEARLAITPSADVQAMLSQVSTDTIARTTRQLTGEESVTVDGATTTLYRRSYNSGTPIQQASHFLGEHLAALGMTPEYHVWNAATNPNVIGQITGRTTPGNIYIIGAHFDDTANSTTNQAPGADDNASGTVGALIAADILSQYKWNCTLRFGFWNGEEAGLLGSKAYAARAKAAGENILGYLNMDMISFNGDTSNAINLFANSSVAGSVAMMDLFADAVSAYGLGLVPVKYLVSQQPVGNQSDNKSFWDQGYASILAIEDYIGGDETPYYHTYNDRLMYSNMAYYTDFVKAGLATFVHLSGCLTSDFRMSAAPATQDVCAPANATYTIGTSSINGFNLPVTLSASGLPSGATATFSPNPVTPGGSSTLTIGPINPAAAGSTSVTVTGASKGLSQSKSVMLHVASGLPAAPALTAPADGSMGIGSRPTFDWDPAAGAASYTLQVATDPAFGSLVIDQGGLTDTSYTPGSALAFDTVYYWRVRASNGCGSIFSTVRAFRTAATGCITYTGADVPKAILNNNTTTPTDSTLTVPNTFTLTDVNVTIGRINHTYDGDLDITILHPDGTSIRLSDDNGLDGDNYVRTVFDDEAATAITAGSVPYTGSYRPEVALSGLDNKGANGAWRLRLYDDATNYGTGSLESWSLTLCGGVTATAGDYSDLAAGYGVAWHTGTGAWRLGNAWDADSYFYAGYDDARSDDGVIRGATTWNDARGEVDVTVTGSAGQYACLNAWLDYSDGSAVAGTVETPNGLFDSNEHVVVNRVMSPGASQVTWPLEPGVINGSASYNMRFRLVPAPVPTVADCSGVTLAPDGGAASTGAATGGEVEDYSFPAGTLAVTLASFSAAATADGVTLAWETVSEVDNAGFNVYRAAGGSVGDRPQQEWTRVNETLIPALAPGSAQGNAYTWTDTAARAGTTWYMLEDVDLNGTATQHEPVSVTVAAPNAVGMAGFAGYDGGLAGLYGLMALAATALAGVAARKRR